MEPFDLAVILWGWVLMLWFQLLRTTRTGSFLALMTILFVGVGLMLNAQMASVLRIVLIGIYLLVFLRGRWWLIGLSRVEGQLDARLRRVTREVADVHDRWLQSYRRGDVRAAREARMKTTRASAAAVTELDRLTAGSAEWRETVRLLREYFVALEAAATVADEQSNGSDERPRRETLRVLNERAIAAWQDAVSRARP